MSSSIPPSKLTHQSPALVRSAPFENRPLINGKKMLQSGEVLSMISSRYSTHEKISRFLKQLNDKELSQLLTTATPIGSGTGGDVFALKVEGIDVFVKKIPLTDIEKQHFPSTKNLFNLPTFYQYGVRSTGFGVSREIAAHEMTTEWVLNRECENFPLMYHSRVLERDRSQRDPTSEQLEAQAKARAESVQYWASSSEVDDRLKAVDEASSDVVVFLEYMPQNLHHWMLHKGQNGTLSEQDLSKLEKELNHVVAFMQSKGFLHFDAHFQNILMHNDQVYLTDFGLAISRQFDLSQQEKDFFDRHQNYDRYFVAAELADKAIRALSPEGDTAIINEYLSDKKMTLDLPLQVASIAERYRPFATIMAAFIDELRHVSKTTPYPAVELSRQWMFQGE